MAWGDSIDSLKAVAETGRRVKALEDRPQVRSGLLLYWQAFWDVSTCRRIGMEGASPVPWTAIDAWARRHGIAGDGFDRLVELIERMDAVWMKDQSKA